MQVAILGAGGVSFAYAAALCRDGHGVVIWSPSGHRTASLAGGAPLIATGAVVGKFHPRAAMDCADAVASAEVVIVALPAYGHRHVLSAAASHLRSEQTVIISSHLSLAALYLQRLLEERGVELTIVALGTTVMTGRQIAPAAVNVGTIRTQVDMAVLPATSAEIGIQACNNLFGNRFKLRAGLLEVTLSNLNPQNHLAIALCNLTRMELGVAWKQSLNITPAVSRLIEALDAERLAVAGAFGLKVRTVHEHLHLSNNLSVASLSALRAAVSQRSGGVNGPTKLDTRYVTEDVPFGVVPTIRLAALVGVSVPLHESGLTLMSALYGRDFEADNDILPLLGDLDQAVVCA